MIGIRLENRKEELLRHETRLLASCEALRRSQKRKKKNKGTVHLKDVAICEQIGRGGSGAKVFNAIVDGW